MWRASINCRCVAGKEGGGMSVTLFLLLILIQEGHRYLVKEFGNKAVPRIGWQIDPFGHSRGTAALFAWDCMDAVVIDRVPYWDKVRRCHL